MSQSDEPNNSSNEAESELSAKEKALKTQLNEIHAEKKTLETRLAEKDSALEELKKQHADPDERIANLELEVQKQRDEAENAKRENAVNNAFASYNFANEKAREMIKNKVLEDLTKVDGAYKVDNKSLDEYLDSISKDDNYQFLFNQNTTKGVPEHIPAFNQSSEQNNSQPKHKFSGLNDGDVLKLVKQEQLLKQQQNSGGIF